MASLNEIIGYCDTLLNSKGFDDYCPNGLQVDAGVSEVHRLATGVTASLALIEAAAAWGADLILVHHGFFWRGESPTLTGIKGARIRALIQNGIGLAAYHLPLDAHPELGNNRGLGDLLGVRNAVPVAGSLLWTGDLEAVTPAELTARLAQGLGRAPLHLPGGSARLARIAWCSGGAQGQIEAAAALGCDAYISGEVAEQTTHLARELGIHYFAAGHHATERFGPRALGLHLAARFGLEQRFLDLPNPV